MPPPPKPGYKSEARFNPGLLGLGLGSWAFGYGLATVVVYSSALTKP